MQPRSSAPIVALAEAEIAAMLDQFSGWSLTDGLLTKSFAFASYAHGLAFASAVGMAAERLDHHPELTIGYRRVTLRVNTHDVNGISWLDFELAAFADSLAD
ncbi:MAG: 4a-hydroxytetrahydrobiopterin dehydratase [Fimbriimonadaceae bacterium]|nr:4a-hydroxytetrahydrobiopterin dehydratase [Fimbriimonadaceae bacterium]